jgi:hypothetical protein
MRYFHHPRRWDVVLKMFGMLDGRNRAFGKSRTNQHDITSISACACDTLKYGLKRLWFLHVFTMSNIDWLRTAKSNTPIDLIVNHYYQMYSQLFHLPLLGLECHDDEIFPVLANWHEYFEAILIANPQWFVLAINLVWKIERLERIGNIMRSILRHRLIQIYIQ